MFPEYVAEFREMAEQCLVLAAAACHVETDTAWLDLAQKWQQLAQLADKYAGEEAARNAMRNGRSALLN